MIFLINVLIEVMKIFYYIVLIIVLWLWPLVNVLAYHAADVLAVAGFLLGSCQLQ